MREKLKELAELRDWSIRQIAIQARIPQQTLAGAMNKHALRVEAAIAIARVMDVDVEWLFDDKKGWKDLPRRPFWLPPGINPGEKISAMKALASGLDQTVRRSHGIESGPQPVKRGPRSRTESKAAAPPRRRKSGG